MYYITGDIHGDLPRLVSLIKKVARDFREEEDTMIFLGDYIDRGPYSYEVIDFLIELSQTVKTVFLKGNHEDMLEKYMMGESGGDVYLINGGTATIESYKRNMGSFTIPVHHELFFRNLKLYFETDDFIAVHAGLHPRLEGVEHQLEHDMLWIRDTFFKSKRKWRKTVIFGHTPASIMTRKKGITIDENRNIIGIDNGVIFGNDLACIRWPDKKIYYSS